MRKHVIPLGTRLFNQSSQGIQMMMEQVWEKYKKNDSDILYGISFGNQFCEHLEPNIDEKRIQELRDIQDQWIQIYYNTSILTQKNHDIVKRNIELLSEIPWVHYVINDVGILSFISEWVKILGLLFYRTRILIRKNLLSNVVLPEGLQKYMDVKKIAENQKNVYENTFDNVYYMSFLTKNAISWVLTDLDNQNPEHLQRLGLEQYYCSPYSYVMSGRNCITHKIAHGIVGTEVTESCHQECYTCWEITTNYQKNIMGSDLSLVGNTIFTQWRVNSEKIENGIIYHIDAL